MNTEIKKAMEKEVTEILNKINRLRVHGTIPKYCVKQMNKIITQTLSETMNAITEKKQFTYKV